MLIKFLHAIVELRKPKGKFDAQLHQNLKSLKSHQVELPNETPVPPCLILEINSTLYVGRFSNTLTDEELKGAFEVYGEVEAARVVYQPSFDDAPKVSRGYGFVKFSKEEDALKAVEGMKEGQVLGKSCRVEISKRDTPRQQTPGRFLGVGREEPSRRHRYRDRSGSRASKSYSRDRDRRRRKHRSSRSRSRSNRKDKRRSDRDRSKSRKEKRDRSRGQEKHRERARSKDRVKDQSKSGSVKN